MANPWRELSAAVRGDLAGPLGDPEVRGWYSKPTDHFMQWHAQYYGTRVPPAQTFPEWRFNHELQTRQRNSLLCVHAKLKREKLWGWVETIRYVNFTGEIDFFPRHGPEELRQHLLKNGYGDWWFADDPTDSEWNWGVRSRFRGTQLHFRGKTDASQPMNGHIDIHNPGDPIEQGAEATNALEELAMALQHRREDLKNRGQTHTPDLLRRALHQQGMTVPAVP